MQRWPIGSTPGLPSATPVARQATILPPTSPAPAATAASLSADRGILPAAGKAAPTTALMAAESVPTAVQLEARAARLGARILQSHSAGLAPLAESAARSNPFLAASLDVRADLASMTWWAREGRVAPLVDVGNQISRIDPMMGRRVFRLAADAGVTAGKTEELLALGRHMASSNRSVGAATLLGGAVRSATRQGELRQLTTIGEEAAGLARALSQSSPQEARQFARVARSAFTQLSRLASQSGEAINAFSQALRLIR